MRICKNRSKLHKKEELKGKGDKGRKMARTATQVVGRMIHRMIKMMTHLQAMMTTMMIFTKSLRRRKRVLLKAVMTALKRSKTRRKRNWMIALRRL